MALAAVCPSPVASLNCGATPTLHHPPAARALTGVSSAVAKVCRERKSRDVYVIGAANVGKSAFVRAMLKEMTRYDGGNFDAGAMSHGGLACPALACAVRHVAW